MRKFYLLLGLVLLPLTSCFWGVFGSGQSHARIAAQLRGEKKYYEAIEEYRKHITARLNDSRREPEENPHFYLILIGDVYLETGDKDKALESYVEAKNKEVETPLIVDRIRRIAKVYRDASRFKEAVEILQKYRDLDPFIFDLDIDENLKSIVFEEDKRR